MFLRNKYSKWYDSIITTAKSRDLVGYGEVHHIIPKSLGGTNTKDNLVKLTAREHFICHMLLPKMTSGQQRYKMINAWLRTSILADRQQEYKIKSHTYESMKKAFSQMRKEIPPWNKGKTGVQIPWNKGKTTPQKGMSYEEIYGEERAKELRLLRSTSLLGSVKSETTKAIWSKNRKGKTNGGLNSNAIPVTINNITYACKNDACTSLNISLYKLNKLLIPTPS